MLLGTAFTLAATLMFATQYVLSESLLIAGKRERHGTRGRQRHKVTARDGDQNKTKPQTRHGQIQKTEAHTERGTDGDSNRESLYLSLLGAPPLQMQARIGRYAAILVSSYLLLYTIPNFQQVLRKVNTSLYISCLSLFQFVCTLSLSVSVSAPFYSVLCCSRR